MIRVIHYNPRLLDPAKTATILATYEQIGNAVILHTCQRLEIYQGVGEISAETARHLYRLTSGLDSIFTGDPSIQGQVRKAYQDQMKRKSLDKYMHRLFQSALYTGKRVRSLTGISQGAINYPQATINLVKLRLGNLKKLRGVVVGVNILSTKLLQILMKEGIFSLSLVNRSRHSGESLAGKLGIPFVPLAKATQVFSESDFVISCTSAGEFIIHPENYTGAKGLLIDLSVPGNIDPRLTTRNGPELICLEDVERSMEQNLQERKKELLKAEAIIEIQLNALMSWQRNSAIHPSHRIRRAVENPKIL